jgi:group I intron endonuclease
VYINRAFLKYGFKNFSLEILEYCESSQFIDIEKDYIKLLSPEYNIIQILRIPPMSDRNHSLENIAKISTANKGENNNMFGKTHSEKIWVKIRQSMSETRRGISQSEQHKAARAAAMLGKK